MYLKEEIPARAMRSAAKYHSLCMPEILLKLRPTSPGFLWFINAMGARVFGVFNFVNFFLFCRVSESFE